MKILKQGIDMYVQAQVKHPLMSSSIIILSLFSLSLSQKVNHQLISPLGRLELLQIGANANHC